MKNKEGMRKGYISINVFMAVFLITTVIIITTETIITGNKITKTNREITNFEKTSYLGESIIKLNIYYGIEEALESTNNEKEFLEKINPISGEYFKNIISEKYYKDESVKILYRNKEKQGYIEKKGRFIYFLLYFKIENSKSVKVEENIYRIENPYIKYTHEEIKNGLDSHQIKSLVKKVK